jgi:hypothetical protein
VAVPKRSELPVTSVVCGNSAANPRPITRVPPYIVVSQRRRMTRVCRFSLSPPLTLRCGTTTTSLSLSHRDCVSGCVAASVRVVCVAPAVYWRQRDAQVQRQRRQRRRRLRCPHPYVIVDSDSSGATFVVHVQYIHHSCIRMGCRLAAVVTIPLLPNEGAVRGSLSLALRDASFRYIGSYISGAPTSAICNCLLRPDAWTYDGVVLKPVSIKGGADASAVIGDQRMRQNAVVLDRYAAANGCDDVYDRAVESMATSPLLSLEAWPRTLVAGLLRSACRTRLATAATTNCCLPFTRLVE